MNDFVAKDTCVLCGDIVGVAINERLKSIEDGPHSLSLCDKCKKKLIDDKMLLVIEIVFNKKGHAIGITGRVAKINEEAIKTDIPNYKKIMKDRVITVNEETFNYLENLGKANGKAQ